MVRPRLPFNPHHMSPGPLEALVARHRPELSAEIARAMKEAGVADQDRLLSEIIEALPAYLGALAVARAEGMRRLNPVILPRGEVDALVDAKLAGKRRGRSL